MKMIERVHACHLHLDRFRCFAVPFFYALAAVALVAYATSGQWGVPVSYDSIFGYIAVAEEISAQGLRFLAGDSAVAQPPLYPILLAVGSSLFHCSMLGFARGLNIFLAVFTLFLVWKTAKQNLCSEIYARLALATCLLSIPLLNLVWLYVWTEALFIVFCLAALHFFAKENLRNRELILAGGAIVMACATRYAGIVLIPIAAVTSMRFLKSAKHIVDWKRILTTVAIPSLCFALYALRNWAVSGTLLGPRYPAEETLLSNIGYVNDGVREWFGLGVFAKSRFVSPVVDLFPNVPLFLIGSAAFAILVYVVRFRMQRSEIEKTVPREIKIHVAFVLVYLSFIVATSTTTAYDRIGQRLLAPAYPSMMVVFFYWLQRLGRGLSDRIAKGACVGLAVSAASIAAIAFLKSLPLSYLLAAVIEAVAVCGFLLLWRKGGARAGDVVILCVVAPFALMWCQVCRTISDIEENGSGLHSAYFQEQEMMEYLVQESQGERTIFCEYNQYALNPSLKIEILPRANYYRSEVKTGITPANVLDRVPTLDGALFVLRTDTIPEEFVNLFSADFPGKLERMKCFRTGCVWKVHGKDDGRGADGADIPVDLE